MDNLTPIPGYESLYLITETGMVFGVKRSKFLKLRIGRDGYFYVQLCSNNKAKKFCIHKLMSLTFFGSQMVDHIDRNKLNNNRSNLRPCSQKQNCANKGPLSTNKSGKKGVSWDRTKSKWRAAIESDGKCKFLGNFDTIELAANAYDSEAKNRYAQFAWLNSENHPN
jgi:hypothetical protein